MPQNIEEAFKAVNVGLFPESSKYIKTDCSCPDNANPCKHIAAVYYILAEEFDRDPFMLFNLRGRTKEDITVSLRKSAWGMRNQKNHRKRLKNQRMFLCQQRVSGAAGNSNHSLSIYHALMCPPRS